MQVPSRQKGNQTERKKKEQAKTKPHDVADKGLKTREQGLGNWDSDEL